jgi:hypothetical protein
MTPELYFARNQARAESAALPSFHKARRVKAGELAYFPQRTGLYSAHFDRPGWHVSEQSAVGGVFYTDEEFKAEFQAVPPVPAWNLPVVPAESDPLRVKKGEAVTGDLGTHTVTDLDAPSDGWTLAWRGGTRRYFADADFYASFQASPRPNDAESVLYKYVGTRSFVSPYWWVKAVTVTRPCRLEMPGGAVTAQRGWKLVQLPGKAGYQLFDPASYDGIFGKGKPAPAPASAPRL